MKKQIVFLFTILLTFGALSASAQKRAPRTVTDYFMLLPAEHINILEYYKNRRSAIKIQDDKNGYLELKEKVWDGETEDAEMALFRQSSGEAVIAIAETNCGMDDCNGDLSLLQYRKGVWFNVREELLAELTEETLLAAFKRIKTGQDNPITNENPLKYYFELPRLGTTVKVLLGGMTHSSGETLVYLKWNGERFSVSETK